MTVHIISDKILKKHVLDEALKQTALLTGEYNPAHPQIGIICDLEPETLKRAKELNCPFISIAGDSSEINIVENLTPSIRLGSLIDCIQYHLRIIGSKTTKNSIKIGDMILDCRESTLIKKGTPPLFLTEKEVMILSTLAQQNGRAITRQDLLDKVWGYASTVETHTLETHIYRLRQKIEEDPSTPSIIVTDENGYRLNF